MFKRLPYILICISVLIIQSHNVFTHHHDLSHENENATHHQDGHNLFSFVDLDEEFTLENKIDLSGGFAATLSFHVVELVSSETKIFNLPLTENGSLPDRPDLFYRSLRAPPKVSFC